MSKIRYIYSFLVTVFFIAGCSSSAVQPLTKEGVHTLLQNPPQNQEKLKTGTIYGCVHLPAKNKLLKYLGDFEKTGESCSITVNEDNTVRVSFLGDVTISLFSTSADGIRTDTFVGELDSNQVLIVQHHQGEVVSVTQTIYDQNGDVVYGKFGEGKSIKSCNLMMTTSERAAGKKDCGK